MPPETGAKRRIKNHQGSLPMSDPDFQTEISASTFSPNKRVRLNAEPIRCYEVKVQQNNIDELQHQIIELKRRLMDVKNQMVRLQQWHSQQQYKVYTACYKRQKGKKASEDERRAVLHCVEVCKLEKENYNCVSSANPIQRAANYLGMSHNTVRDIVKGKNAEDFRGKYTRQNSMPQLESDLRQIATSMNLKGEPVTINRLRERLGAGREGLQLPGSDAIRKAMLKLGFHYGDVKKTKNFIETQSIKEKRHQYLQERYSEKYKDALFVWLDESYCNQYHTINKSWFMPGMTVYRRARGRRYIIVHSGSKEGWVGEPRIWIANEHNGDYHKSMNASAFEEYFEELCRYCKQDKEYPSVVFCMDNASYHRREHHINGTSKALRQFKKGELIQRLVRMGAQEDNIKKLKRPELYTMAKEERYKVPLAVEVIAQK
jgi:hypothetical protein